MPLKPSDTTLLYQFATWTLTYYMPHLEEIRCSDNEFTAMRKIHPCFDCTHDPPLPATAGLSGFNIFRLASKYNRLLHRCLLAPCTFTNTGIHSLVVLVSGSIPMGCSDALVLRMAANPFLQLSAFSSVVISVTSNPRNPSAGVL